MAEEEGEMRIETYADLAAALEPVRERIGMFIGPATLVNFSAFMTGVVYVSGLSFHRDFYVFLGRTHDVTTPFGWPDAVGIVAERRNIHDDEAQVQLAFDLIDDFCRRGT